MSHYIGPWRRSPLTGLFWRTICFTRWHAGVIRAWLLGYGALVGAALGFITGLFFSFLGVASTAELPPATILSLAIGAALTVLLTKIGAGIGGITGAIIAYEASCPTCGICIEFPFHQVLGHMLPMPPFIPLPRTADCTVLIPPGCP